MTNPKVSILVLNYNGREFLKNCFDSIKKTDYDNYEVLIVDNNSTDDSISFMKKNYPWVKIIRSKKNIGFAGGNNIGIKKSSGKYVVLLGSDTICNPDWLKKIVDLAESSHKIGIVSSWPLNIEFLETSMKNFPHKIKEVAKVSGTCMMIKREIFEKIGFLEEKYFMYWEDTEFCYRTILAGYKILINYDSIVFHIGGGSAKKQPSKKWKYEMTKNRLHMHFKLMSPFYLIFFIIFELGKLLFNFIKIPSDFFLYRKIYFDAFLKAWEWNISKLMETKKERVLIRKRLGNEHENYLIWISIKTSMFERKNSIIMNSIKKAKQTFDESRFHLL